MRNVRTDANRRITLPGSRPGQVYEVIEEEPDHYSLARLVTHLPRVRHNTESEVEEAMKAAPLKTATTWEQLRKLTRKL